MGCASSRAEESPLVVLCRERRELIRAAGESRYALAAAHAAYFRALAAVGDALHRFAQEGLAVPSSPPASPVLTLPSSPKPKPKPSTDAGNGGASSSITSISYSISSEDGSHIHLSPDPDSDPSQKGSEKLRGVEDSREASSSPPPPAASPSPSYYYMRSSTAFPSMVYEDPYTQNWSNPLYNGYNYNYPPYGVPIGSPPESRDDPYYYNRPMMSPPREREAPPPPPPPPPPAGVSTWDFFNPFDSYEHFLPGYGNAGYGMASVVSSPSSSEVREREGIPDLEEETEPEHEKKAKKERKKKVVVDDDLGQMDFGVGSSDSVPTKEMDVKDETVGLEEKENSSKGKSNSSSVEESKESSSNSKRSSKRGLEDKKAKSSGEETSSRSKVVSFEEEMLLNTEESRPSNGGSLPAHGARESATLAAQGTRDVMEVVKEIKEHFKSAAGIGEQVARILEVGKLPYRSKSRILRVICSRILDPVTLPMKKSSCPSFKRSRHFNATTFKTYKARYADFDRQSGTESHTLSSTLDELYVWEKKLYKEVKDEEKLRFFYEKKCRQLKDLDDRGAESYKIESTQASIRRLRTKISIAIKSVDSISNRMHRLRGQELQPRLTELIKGMISMWKSMLACHQKQLQAILASKSHNLMARTGIYGTSAAKATIELELELLNWSSCFCEWISKQKDYMEALNGWLLKWLPQEQEVTPDGVIPFSPSRIGAPAIFIISNDWCHAVQSISEVDVTKAMHSFVESVHRLWESQDEEQRQQLRAEYLSKDFAQRLQSLRKEIGMQGHLDIVSTSGNGEAYHDDRMTGLDSIKKRLDEEKAKHEETVKKVHEAASGSLRMGLIPIFEALGNFTSQTLKAYEGLRIPNEGRET